MENNKPTFEQDLQRLEQIVRAMERGEMALDDSIKLFQEGTELARRYAKRLDEAQMQVNLILSNEQGEPVQEGFEHAVEG